MFVTQSGDCTGKTQHVILFLSSESITGLDPTPGKPWFVFVINKTHHMKYLIFAYCFLISVSSANAQNVGIGEITPGAKLTIKTTDLIGRPLLIKTSTDDSTLFILGNHHYINGFSNSSSSSLTINNKSFLPLDNPQLTVMASGERSGINANGSVATVDFRNINSDKKFSLYSYTGNAIPNYFALYYFPSSLVSKPLLHITETGSMGLGTYNPSGKLQIDHRSSLASPTLYLFDSSTTGGSIVQFRNAGGAKSWQIRAILNHSTPNNDFLDFMNNGAILATLGNSGNFGIGTPSPAEKLDVVGTIKLSGELNRTSTGTSNMVPIAYGNIATSGFINSGSGNFSVSKITTGWYAITITGESYQFQTYTSVITPVGSGAAIMVGTGSGGGNLYVYTYNASGVATDNQFCFVAYKQ